MNNSLNVYPVFEDNQVLTSTQLNEMVAYLDEQSRLTRANLLGTGISCGLEIKYETLSGSGDSAVVKINLSAGGGVTSQGYLINTGACDLVKKRTYTLPLGSPYSHFNSFGTIYEALTSTAETLSTDVVTNLTEGDCKDRVLLLFLETLDVDLNSCLGKACDENGLERVFNLRRLLVLKSDVNSMNSANADSPIPFIAKLNLPELILKRPLLDPATTSTQVFANFSDTIRLTLTSNFLNFDPAEQNMAQVPFEQKLLATLRETYTTFELILSKVYGGANPFPSTWPAAWSTFLSSGSSSTGPAHLGMQYFYDFFSDLVMAYNEFRAYANELIEECCVNSAAFPKHLLISEAKGVSLTEGSSNRHYFKPSPLVNGQSIKADAAIFYHKRLVMLFKKFDFAMVNNPYTNSRNVLVTPSIQNSFHLSKRSIPFYYKADEAESSLGGIRLWQTWNYNYKAKGLLAKGIKPYGYYAQPQSDPGAIIAHSSPMYYEHGSYDSYRIEGHLGKDVNTAKTSIENIIKSFDLPINVLDLKLANAGAFDPLSINIDDLRADYAILRQELLSMFEEIKKVLIKTPNTSTPNEDLPAFLDLLLDNLLGTNVQLSYNQPTIDYIEAHPSYSFDLGNFPVIFPGETSPRYLDLSGILEPSSGGSANAVSYSGPVPATRHSIDSMREQYDTAVNSLISNLNKFINNTNSCLPFNLTDIAMGVPASPANSEIPGFVSYMFNAIEAAIGVKVLFNQIQDAICRNTKLRQVPELFFTLGSYFNEVFNMLERLIRNSQYTGIRLAYYSYMYRRNDYMNNDPRLFKNFIKKHSGITHTSAVKAGGTFVLLSNGATISGGSYNISQSDIIADFSLPYRVDSACLCYSAPPITTLASLSIPALSIPYYVEYSLGDFAYAENLNYASHNSSSELSPVFIDVSSQLSMYIPQDHTMRLYLVDLDGTTIPPEDDYTLPESPIGNYGGTVWGTMPTLNGCYDATNTNNVTFGTAYLIGDDNAPTDLKFVYVPEYNSGGATAFNGVDSFYYMFDIINSSGQPVKRSNIGKITIFVDRTATNLT